MGTAQVVSVTARAEPTLKPRAQVVSVVVTSGVPKLARVVSVVATSQPAFIPRARVVSVTASSQAAPVVVIPRAQVISVQSASGPAAGVTVSPSLTVASLTKVFVSAAYNGGGFVDWEWRIGAGPVLARVDDNGASATVWCPAVGADTDITVEARAVLALDATPWKAVAITVRRHTGKWMKLFDGTVRGMGAWSEVIAPGPPVPIPPPPVDPPPDPPPVDPPPVVTPPPAGTPTYALWYERSPLTADPDVGRIMPHHFPPFPINVQNTPQPTYNTVNWDPPGAIEGGVDYELCGGYTRDDPMDPYARPQSTALTANGVNFWREQDAREQVRQAALVGMDGFWLEGLGTLTGQQGVRSAAIAQAADDLFPDGRFKASPMPDINNSTFAAATPDFVADYFAFFAYTNPTVGLAANQYVKRPCAWFLGDGRFVVSCFMGDNWTNARWVDIDTACFTRYKFHIALINVLNNYNLRTNYPFQYAVSSWGGAGADPGPTNAMGSQTAQAAALGVLHMWSVWAQGNRPSANVARTSILADNGAPPGTGNVGLYDEARNTGSLRAHLNNMVQWNPKHVQVTTWSDFREGAMAIRTAGRGRVISAIIGYYKRRWKEGKFPPILIDAVILTHRNQPFPSWTFRNPSVKYTRKSGHWNRGASTSTIRNTVEVLSYLTAPAQMTLKVGGSTYTYTAPAGEFVYDTAPWEAGTVSVTWARNGTQAGSHTSPIKCVAVPFVQNSDYFMSMSCDPDSTAAQYDASEDPSTWPPHAQPTPLVLAP